MVLLTEQTRDWEQGKQDAVLRGVRRYTMIAAVLMLVVVPPLLYWMPTIVTFVYSARFAQAGNAARVFLLVAAVQMLVGWTKSFQSPSDARTSGSRLPHGASRTDPAADLPLGSISSGASGAVVRGACREAFVRWMLGGDLFAHQARRRCPTAADRGGDRARGERSRGHRAVKVLVVSGIWPPDVGGPASHAPDVAAFLHARGHDVEVVTTAANAPAPQAYPVRWVSRSLPKGLIHLRTAAEIARRAVHADVVYTTGMFGRSSAGSLAARRPYVLKLTADPAFERARRRGMVDGDVETFQRLTGDAAVRALRVARNFELRRATRVHAERVLARPRRLVGPVARAGLSASEPDSFTA